MREGKNLILALGDFELAAYISDTSTDKEGKAMNEPTKNSGVQSVNIPLEQITDGVCPKCGSDEIAGEFVETGGGIAVQEISCGVCDCRWKNVYDFAAVYLIDEDLVIAIPREAQPAHECSLDESGICYNETEELNDECRERRLVASYGASKDDTQITAAPEFEPEQEQVTRARRRRGMR